MLLKTKHGTFTEIEEDKSRYCSYLYGFRMDNLGKKGSPYIYASAGDIGVIVGEVEGPVKSKVLTCWRVLDIKTGYAFDVRKENVTLVPP